MTRQYLIRRLAEEARAQREVVEKWAADKSTRQIAEALCARLPSGE